jgi:uncharacterized membrane protein
MSRWATRFRRRQYLKGSLWALPLCGCVIGVLLAQLLLWIDSTVHIKALMHYSSSTATGVLTAIIGAMVALLGFVVTIGVLVIQQATATLSPRFMRLWYRDRLQKVVLATFAGTFTYSFALPRRYEFRPRPWRYHCGNCGRRELDPAARVPQSIYARIAPGRGGGHG